MARVVAGLDVGKAELHVHASGEERRVANTPAGFRALRNWLSKRDVQRVVTEPAGRYHRRVHQSLVASGLEVVLVNPLRRRRFGEAVGDLAKTDRIDAAMLANLGATMPNLDGTKPMEGPKKELEGLLVARSRLVDVRTSVAMTAQELGGSAVTPLKCVCRTTENRMQRSQRTFGCTRSGPDAMRFSCRSQASVPSTQRCFSAGCRS